MAVIHTGYKAYIDAEVIVVRPVANPTADTVEMAFPVTGVEPVGGDWKGSIWYTDTTSTPTRYYARCLVGTTGTSGGAVTLADGLYDVWVRVTDSPEVPVLKTGKLEVV